MTKRQSNRGRRRHDYIITVHGVRREVPDTRKLARALIALAKAEVEQQQAPETEQRDAPDEEASS
jgi:hypothetical protein